MNVNDWIAYCGTLQDFLAVEQEVVSDIRKYEYRDEFMFCPDYATYKDEWC